LLVISIRFNQFNAKSPFQEVDSASLIEVDSASPIEVNSASPIEEKPHQPVKKARHYSQTRVQIIHSTPSLVFVKDSF
jgi:hypothetical protein